MAGKKLMLHLQKIIICPRVVETRGQGCFTVVARFSKPLTQASSIQPAGNGYNVYDQVRAKYLYPYSLVVYNVGSICPPQGRVKRSIPIVCSDPVWPYNCL